MKVNMNKKWSDFSKSIRKKQPAAMPSRLEWGIALVMAGLFFLTMFYADNLGIFLTYFWTNEELFTGKSFNALGYTGLPYGILHQWMCELWVLPVNLLYHLFGASFDGIAAMLWYKLFVILFYILCVAELGKIAKLLGLEQDKVRWLQFFTTTSLLVALPVFHVAQTDTLYLFFMLLGFHALLEGKNKKFLICFALAIPLKIIAIFAFIPLMLLAEKRIWRVLRNLILGCIIIPVEQIIYRFVNFLNASFITPGQTAVTSRTVEGAVQAEDVKSGFMSHFYHKTLYFEFPAVRKGLVASLLILVFALLCIWCYMQKKEELKQWYHQCIYTIVGALSIFFVMASPSPYWIMILYPFLLLMVFMNPECFRINMLLQTGFTLTMFFVYLIDTYWVFGGSQTFDWLFLSKWGLVSGNHVFQEGPSIGGYLEKYGISEMMPLMTAACLACIIGLLWINYPGKGCQEKIDDHDRVVLSHGFGWFNLAVMVFWYIGNIVLLGRY